MILNLLVGVGLGWAIHTEIRLRRAKLESDGYKQAAAGLAVRCGAMIEHVQGASKVISCLMEAIPEAMIRIPADKLNAIQVGATHTIFIEIDPATQDRIVMLKTSGERPA